MHNFRSGRNDAPTIETGPCVEYRSWSHGIEQARHLRFVLTLTTSRSEEVLNGRCEIWSAGVAESRVLYHRW